MKNQTTPEPRSRFLIVRCECNKEQVAYSHSTSEVKCDVCGKVLAEPTGGKAKILGDVIEVLD
ncbi:MAG: 30S ribosomal protein S27e [Candidatus Ranarchaeia archaeon]|jgi:small subunit ribosomal protein S27e